MLFVDFVKTLEIDDADYPTKLETFPLLPESDTNKPNLYIYAVHVMSKDCVAIFAFSRDRARRLQYLR